MIRRLLVLFPFPLFATLVPPDPAAYVTARLAAGERTIVVPKGDYRLSLPEGKRVYFEFSGLRDVTINFSGSRLWGTVKSRMFDLRGCTNVTVRNVTVDYPFDLPFTQAEILEVEAEQAWRVKVIPGYPCPDEAQLKGRIWPVQAYSRDGSKMVNPMRFRDGIAITRLGADEYRVSGGLDRRGCVGDIAVWSVGEYNRKNVNGAFVLTDCSGCTLENCTVHATPMGCGFVEFGSESNTYRRCRLDRCPPESDPVPRGLKRLRSGNHDAFNSRRSYRGPTLEECRFAWHCDDCVNISGFYGLVTRQDGRVLRVCTLSDTVPCFAGDRCQVMTRQGVCPPDVTAVSCVRDGQPTAAERTLFQEMKFWPGIAERFNVAFRVEIDGDAALTPGSMIISNRRQGNGFVIRNCSFGPNRARGLLLKASDGVVTGNRIVGVEGYGIQIAAENPWMEGGCSRNLRFERNVLEKNGKGITIGGVSQVGTPLPPEAHRNIFFFDNRVTSPAPALQVTGCTGLVLSNNVFDVEGGRTVELLNCRDVVSSDGFDEKRDPE